MHNDEISYKPVAFDWLDEFANPDFAKTAPDLIGRVKGEKVDMESVRSETDCLVSVSVPFNGGAIGVAIVSIFESNSCGGHGGGDDGGLVFRLTIRNDASAFQPHAVLIADGVDLHIAGDEEAAALLSTLHKATTQARRIRHAPRRLTHVGEVNAQILPATGAGPKKH